MIKTIVFWGGYTNHCHELVKALADLGYEVCVIMGEDNGGRTERIPTDKGQNVSYRVCRNTAECVSNIIREYDRATTLHINGSLKAIDDYGHRALKYLARNGYHVMSLPQESFQLQGMRGKLNYLKWLVYLNFTFRRKIMAYGITGLNAERHFHRLFVSRSKVFQFMYVTKTLDDKYLPQEDTASDDGILRMIYVGAIDERKNIIPFVDFMQRYPRQNFELEIYGSWTLDDVLREKVKDTPNINYYGKKDYDTVRKAMAKSDYLVIPSLYDGWAAVGTEGLQAGCKLLVSKECGCSILVSRNAGMGHVFSSKNPESMKKCVDLIFSEKKEKGQHRRIKAWSDARISPVAVAAYFDKVIRHYFENAPVPDVPWVTEKD